MESYSVFYLVGGSTNFVCRSVTGRHLWETALKEVNILQNMGYKAMSVKNGHIIGGYCSATDFDMIESAKEYYNSL